MRSAINLVEAGLEYRGEHNAPNKESGASLFNLFVIFPKDVYTAPNLYTHESFDRECLSIANDCKGRPNKLVTIYRSVSKELVSPKISPGDWVSLSRAYVVDHGRSNLNNSFKIIKKTVAARDVFTDGDLAEWGYDPQPVIDRNEEDQIRRNLGLKTSLELRNDQKLKIKAALPVSQAVGDINYDEFLTRANALFGKPYSSKSYLNGVWATIWFDGQWFFQTLDDSHLIMAKNAGLFT